MTTTTTILYVCARCAREFSDIDSFEIHEHWHARKDDGAAVAALLAVLPEGATFKLATGTAPRAYQGIYRKNADGLFDQVFAPDAPLVRNMDAAHLGFCVGRDAIGEAIRSR